MPYLFLPNFNYDSGPRRIQSGPNHEGYVVLYSGVQLTGADDGIVVAGTPLSGTLASGAWGYDANWRYVPSTLPSQNSVLDPTPYNVSGALGTYDGVRIYTRNTVAGAQIASAIGPQPGSTVNRPEKYMYFGGAAPDNQNYSPYNTPDANSAAEGKTGGGVTHRTFESSLLTNVLGSQGTSDRSQWRYHQPVYCKTYTETKRSEVPGLMSTPLRAVYRGGSTSYNYNYGSELLARKGGVGGGGGGGGGGLYAELEDGVPSPSGVVGIRATSFGSLTVNYFVMLDKSLQSGLKNLGDGIVDEWITQDNVKIFADRVTGESVEAVVGFGAISNRIIPYVGAVTWTSNPAEKELALAIKVSPEAFGVPFNPYLFRFVSSRSNLNVVRGAICFSLALPTCDNPPFTGQTYGQVAPGYEESLVIDGFASGPIVSAPGVSEINIGDAYFREFDIVPPLPGRPWFQQHKVEGVGGYSHNPLYSSSRTAMVTLVPYSSVKTTLTRVSANRFRLYMDQQAVGGVMVLRYSAGVTPDRTRFTLGFSAPTIVYIPADEREAFFDVTPGAYASYTVTLEKCFGLPDLIDAQFWPLEPDPVQFVASGV